MSVRAAIVALLAAGPAAAQGFAGLGADAEGFTLPAPDPVFDFPADHGPHPDFRIEWWYLTSNLTGADGAEYGIQWTLFRTALEPERTEGWNSQQIWFGHAAVTTETGHRFTERWARDGIGQAGVETAPFRAWIDDWQMESWALPGEDALSAITLAASAPDFTYNLKMEAAGPLIFHGQGGYSVKSDAGQASYYYSQPHYEVTGMITLPDGTVDVTGTAWLDREWSSAPLAENQTGWDWFSLHFDDGSRLMGYRLRDDQGGAYAVATWIGPGGETETYADGQFSATPLRRATVAGREVPVDWQVRLPDKGIDITTEALFDGAWMGTTVSYWEGPVRVSGSHTGRGYLEMTGYE